VKILCPFRGDTLILRLIDFVFGLTGILPVAIILYFNLMFIKDYKSEIIHLENCVSFLFVYSIQTSASMIFHFFITCFFHFPKEKLYM
jgi:hypothetical protein